MANYRGSSNVRNIFSGKHALLPPKSPFPSISPPYADYVPSLPIGSKAVQKPREGSAQHQRTSSESFLIEEQPSWLDDLLNEPETPVRRGGHRRSSSDSFAHVDTVNASTLDYAAQDDYRNRNISWSREFDRYKDAQRSSFFGEANLPKPKSGAWDLSMNARTRSHPSNLPCAKDNMILQSTGLLAAPREADGVLSAVCEKPECYESNLHAKTSSEIKDSSHIKSPVSDPDTKRAKQQYAQRSRVRKLQYIAELERNVQALQAEGSKVSAELKFLNQQNLILSMENKALKQRLENLAQEQIIKYLEQEVLEREMGRLRALYQKQQQPQQKSQSQLSSSSHQRSRSSDLDSQFTNLNLKHKDANSARDPVSGPLRV